MSGLRVIAGGKDSARAAQRRHARPYLQQWLAAGRALARGGGPVKLRPVHVACMDELTKFPSANEFYVFPSQRTIGERMGLSERQTRRLFSDLKSAKLIAPKLRGLGKTAIWQFCIDGAPLFTGKFSSRDQPSKAGLDRPSMAAQDRPSKAALDRPPKADKPYEYEPFEYEPLEIEPSRTPSPPPNTALRAREAEMLADVVLTGLSPAQRKSHRWKGLARWIAAKIEGGCQEIDVSTGILEALDTLKGATPSTFDYFTKPIDRARASRLKPLPIAGSSGVGHVSPAVPSQVRMVGYMAERLGVGAAVVTALGSGWLAEQHRQFVAQTIGMPEIIAAARERMAQGGAE